MGKRPSTGSDKSKPKKDKSSSDLTEIPVEKLETAYFKLFEEWWPLTCICLNPLFHHFNYICIDSFMTGQPLQGLSCRQQRQKQINKHESIYFQHKFDTKDFYV